jgi:hypothetical protein
MGYMKFINESYVLALLGKNLPISAIQVAKYLDKYLNHLCDEGYALPVDLLMHNVSPNRDRKTSEFAKIDTDFRLDVDAEKQNISIAMLDYTAANEVERPYQDRRVVLHILVKNKFNTSWAVHIPLQAVMLGFGNPSDGYQCYAHFITFLGADGTPSDRHELYYCGITKRGWLKRMSEHFRKSEKESKNKFHQEWRKYQGDAHVMLNSELIALNHTHEGAMLWEEWMVAKYIVGSNSLNTIHGGFKGLEELGVFKLPEGAREGMKTCPGFQVSYFGNVSRKGITNPYMKKLWEDDQFYAKSVGNRANAFSQETIAKIRGLARDGLDAAAIGKQLGVSNLRRLSNIMKGKTYHRM